MILFLFPIIIYTNGTVYILNVWMLTVALLEMCPHYWQYDRQFEDIQIIIKNIEKSKGAEANIFLKIQDEYCMCK